MRSTALLGRLIGLQGAVLALLVLLLLSGGLLLLPPVEGRDHFLVLLLALCVGAAVLLLTLVRGEADRLERPLRALTAAIERCENGTASRTAGVAGDAIDAAADAFDRLRAR